MEKGILRFLKGLRIVNAALIIVCGLLLMHECAYIYFTDGAFTRARVAMAFSEIAVPVITCLLIVLADVCVLSFVFPNDKLPQKARPLPLYALRRLRKRKEPVTDAYAVDTINKLHRKRLLICLIGGGCTVLPFAVAVVLAVLAARARICIAETPMEATDFMLSMLVLLPLIALTVAFAYFTEHFYIRSASEEVLALRLLPDAEKEGAPTRKNVALPLAVRIAFIVLGLAFIAYGIYSGGVAAVFGKAARICTECIGLG